MPTFDHLIFIGRFQPFHRIHHDIIVSAFKQTNHLIILIGSANSPRTLQNPFSFEERANMINNAYAPTAEQRLTCLPLDDTLYNDTLWLQHAQRQVANVTVAGDTIALINHHKGNSLCYLEKFPTWHVHHLPSIDHLSETSIRHAYFDTGTIAADKLPLATISFLEHFKHTQAYQTLVQEHQHICKYQSLFAALPYPPIFQTVDALVVQAGHVLVIRRGGDYGKGQLALPGGFVDANETLQASVVRELIEETGLDLSTHRPSGQHTFDSPNRSLRARTITTVFVYELTGDTLPALQAGDDAKEVFWLPVHHLSKEPFFEDHYSILVKILGLW